MWQAHRRKIAAFLLIALPIALLGSSAGAEVGTERNVVARTFSAGVTLAQTGTSGVLGDAGAWIGSFFGGTVAEENERLKAEVARLREEKTRLIGVLQENERLRELVGFKERHDEFELAPARVIARDITPYFRVLKIAIDTPEGVELKPRMPVMTSAGVVGQIHTVYGDYADVIIAADPRSRIDAVAQRTRARGLVEGLGHDADYLARVGYLRNTDEIREGDVFVTSGMGGIFPAEIVIGTVVEVEDGEDGLFQQARVEPSVDFSRLEEVFVLVGGAGD